MSKGEIKAINKRFVEKLPENLEKEKKMKRKVEMERLKEKRKQYTEVPF